MCDAVVPDNLFCLLLDKTIDSFDESVGSGCVRPGRAVLNAVVVAQGFEWLPDACAVSFGCGCFERVLRAIVGKDVGDRKREALTAALKEVASAAGGHGVVDL